MAEKMRLGVIGLGQRGSSLIRDLFVKLPDIVVTAVSDVYKDRVDTTCGMIAGAGFPKPFGTTDYREMVDKKYCDMIVIASPWAEHVPMAVYCMEHGMPSGSEVGGAITLDECFKLVETYERTKTPFMFLENCIYGRREMMALNMAEQGVFGQIVHCEGGYRHDLRDEIAEGKERRHYRLREYLTRNCENYPTHELGPMARVLGIGKNNRFTSLVSVSGKSFGLHDYIGRKKADDEQLKDAVFAQGDIFTTVLKCENGATATLVLDTTLPRYYSRNFTVRGTRGLYEEVTDSVFLEDEVSGADHWYWKPQWGNAAKYAEKYEHDVWKEYLKSDMIGGHDGIDYLVYTDFFNAVRDGKPMPIDVYEGAVLMAVTPLSEISAREGREVEFPRFDVNKTK